MLKSLWTALVLALLATPARADQPPPPFPPVDEHPACKTTYVPDGYVIVAETFLPGCYGRGGEPNAWIVHRAVEPEIQVCRASEIPPGYLIVANAIWSNTCPRAPGAQFNAYLIRIPWDQEVVCRSNVIDSNLFRTLGVTATYDCSELGPRDNALTIERRSTYRAYCGGRVLGAPANTWRLVFDRDDQTALSCAQGLAAEFAALGAARWEIYYGEYQYDARLDVKIDCAPRNLTYIYATGRKAFEMASDYVPRNGWRDCLITPTSFPIQKLTP